MSRTISLLALSSLAALVACAPDAEGIKAPASPDAASKDIPAEDSGDAIIALYLANSLDQDTLDFDVTLDSRAAANIVTTRAGADGVEGTSDDVVFETIEQLDAVSYVGASAMDDLVAYGSDIGLTGEVTLGVLVGSVEEEAVLYLANNLSQDALDNDVRLDSRAASNIVAAGTISSLSQFDGLGYVGNSAMSKMLSFADGMLAGDGIVLRDGTAYDTLQDAVDAGGSLYIDLYKGTYQAGETTIADTLIITGYADGGTVLDGGGSSRVLNISAGSPCFYDMEIINGAPTSSGYTEDGGAVAISGNGSVLFDNVDFTDNVGYFGGAIYSTGSTGSLTISNSSLSGNEATGLGGAIYSYGDVTLSGVNLQGNTAGGGAAVRLFDGYGVTPHLSISDSTVYDNANSYWGSIALSNATMTTSNVDFDGNTPVDVYLSNGSTYSVSADMSCDTSSCI